MYFKFHDIRQLVLSTISIILGMAFPPHASAVTFDVLVPGRKAPPVAPHSSVLWCPPFGPVVLRQEPPLPAGTPADNASHSDR